MAGSQPETARLKVQSGIGIGSLLLLMLASVCVAGVGTWAMVFQAEGTNDISLQNDVVSRPSVPNQTASSPKNTDKLKGDRDSSDAPVEASKEPPELSPEPSHRGGGLFGGMLAGAMKPAAPEDTVTIVVDDAGDRVKQITARATKLSGARRTQSTSINGRLTLKLSVVKDLDALAKAIDFGTVRDVDPERRMIFVRIGSPADDK